MNMLLGIGYPKSKVTVANVDGLQAVAKNSEKFAATYFQKLAKSYPGNLITSPISTQVVLAMAAYGANGRTSTEMRSALKLPRGIELGQSGYKSVIETLNRSKGVELHLAHKLYTASHLAVKPTYEELLTEKFLASREALNFDKPAAAAKVLNNWCEENTFRRIKKIVTTAALRGDNMITLVNAVYFKGYWESRFDPALTKPRPFYVDENTIKRVPTMFIGKTFRSGGLSKLDARIIEVPYEGGSISMVIILPNQVNGLRIVLENLDKVNLRQKLNAGYDQRVELYLPRFKVKNDLALNPVLVEMGMVSMFQMTANFSGMTDAPAFITNVLQAAFIEVREDGTEATAYTRQTGGGPPPPPPQEFKVDRPFYFVILHRSTGIHLFSGVVHHPSAR